MKKPAPTSNGVEAEARARVDELLQELERYRLHSERLQQINELYKRMAGIADMPTMIETFSVWLMHQVDHDLIGFRDPERQRQHLYCSSHGPRRRQVLDTALELVTHLPAVEQGENPRKIDAYSCHLWPMQPGPASSYLILLRRDEPLTPEEIELVTDALGVLREPVRRALEYEEIFEQARRDALTGLPNRLFFEERISSLLERARRYGYPLTLAALDLDHFKEINDTMGHLAGDQALKKVATTLQQQIRMNDLLVRIGGDEFLLILPDTTLEAARSLNERLCQAIADLRIGPPEAPLGISIGLAQWKAGMTLTQWLEKADDVLYQAKARGRSRVATSSGRFAD